MHHTPTGPHFSHSTAYSPVNTQPISTRCTSLESPFNSTYTFLRKTRKRGEIASSLPPGQNPGFRRFFQSRALSTKTQVSLTFFVYYSWTVHRKLTCQIAGGIGGRRQLLPRLLASVHEASKDEWTPVFQKPFRFARTRKCHRWARIFRNFVLLMPDVTAIRSMGLRCMHLAIYASQCLRGCLHPPVRPSLPRNNSVLRLRSKQSSCRGAAGDRPLCSRMDTRCALIGRGRSRDTLFTFRLYPFPEELAFAVR